jgi:hypothetical protein
MFVREILARKGRDVKRIGADQALEVAAALMRLQSELPGSGPLRFGSL